MNTQSNPIRAVGEALAGLERRMLRNGDPNAYFVSMYRVTTERCRRTVDAITNRAHPRHVANRHLDPRLISDIVCHFAPRYLEPWQAFEESALGPANPWLRVFRSAPARRPATVLLLGAHTHICFDLPLVLAARTAPGVNLFDPADTRQRRTLDALNAIFIADLARIMARVRRSERHLAGRAGSHHGGVARLLYGARRRRAFQPMLTLLLGAARSGARRDAMKLQLGALDEPTLAAVVERRNHAFLAIQAPRRAAGNPVPREYPQGHR